jgi:uncharacterized membrane protein HdeD (DUF308 family)
MARAGFENRTVGALALKGAIAIVFGIIALAQPRITVVGLVYLFGAYAFIDGIFAIAASANVAQMNGRWGALFLAGIIGIVVGVLAFVNPSATALGMLYYIALWAVVTGIFEIAAAIRLRKVVEGEWLLALAGAMSIAFGVVIAMRPGAGMVSIVWFLGSYAIVLGVLFIALALRLRATRQRLVTA